MVLKIQRNSSAPPCTQKKHRPRNPKFAKSVLSRLTFPFAWDKIILLVGLVCKSCSQKRIPRECSLWGFLLDSIFNREAGGHAAPVPSLTEVVLMSTYEELHLIVSVAVLIVAILTYTHKK